MKGERHHSWNDGVHVDSNGYILVLKPDHPKCNKNKRVFEHRLVYEEYYNCCLLDWTVIHHKDGNPANNKIENLEPFINQSEHVKHERQIRKWSRKGIKNF